MNFCPHCGNALQPDQRFCGKCGKAVAEQTPANVNLKACPTCGKEVGVTAAKCPHCGTVLVESTSELLINMYVKLAQNRILWAVASFSACVGLFSMKFDKPQVPWEAYLPLEYHVLGAVFCGISIFLVFWNMILLQKDKHVQHRNLKKAGHVLLMFFFTCFFAFCIYVVFNDL